MIRSNRQFKYIGLDEFLKETRIKFDLNTLVCREDGTEFEYTIQENTDEILDLNIGDSLYMQIARDEPKAKGIVVRIN